MTKQAEIEVKLKNLKIEVSKMWNAKAEIIPIIVGALRATPRNVQKNLEKIPGNNKMAQIQDIVLCGTAHILRNVLSKLNLMPPIKLEISDINESQILTKDKEITLSNFIKSTAKKFGTKKGTLDEKSEDCIYCGQSFTHKLLLKHKLEEEKCLKCQYCDKNFENVQLFRKHTYRYHKYYSCKICNIKFLKGPYEYHMSSVHKKRPECKVCHKTFATKLSLTAHEKKIHLGLRDERFKCQVCQYKAPDKFQYKVHMSRHNKAPSFVCDYCGAGHYTKTELNKHIQADHCGGYRCNTCNKSYRSPEYLKRHEVTHEPGYDPSKINFSCNECGKGFLIKLRFKQHMLQHKNQLPTYHCDSCGKNITSKASLKLI